MHGKEFTGDGAGTAYRRSRKRRLGEQTVRITFRLRGDEFAAVRAYAETRRWDMSTTIRVILREKLLDEAQHA